MTEIERLLAEPFETSEVKWKPGKIEGSRALALCYVDARLVMDRLDEVFGVMGWKDDYEVLPSGCIACRLSVRDSGDVWVTKMDVGGLSEQPDDGDKEKAAFSDALKRTAVKWGIGRYLYRLGSSWCDYDPVKKRIVKPPQLPPWAIPTPPPPVVNEELRGKALAILVPASSKGLEAYAKAWETLSPDMRKAVAADHPTLKEKAKCHSA